MMDPEQEFEELVERLSKIEASARSLGRRARLLQERVEELEATGAWAALDQQETNALRAYANREGLEPGEAALELVRRGLQQEPILAGDEGQGDGG